VQVLADQIGTRRSGYRGALRLCKTNPMLTLGSPIHDGDFRELKALGEHGVRWVPWLPLPQDAVASAAPGRKRTH